jgi:hypothetical protein
MQTKFQNHIHGNKKSKAELLIFYKTEEYFIYLVEVIFKFVVFLEMTEAKYEF